jgi:Domain of unknown function (DUF4281)
MNTIFRVSNWLIIPFWFLMIVFPRWRWTRRIMNSPYVSAAPALLYAGLVLPRLGAIWPAVTRPTMGRIAALLASPAGATIAWVHFLAFDLLVGRWIYLDAQERQVPALIMAPVLFLTLTLGPAGFLLYLAVRFAGRLTPHSETTHFGHEVLSEKITPSLSQVARQATQASRKFVDRALRVNRPLTLLGIIMAFTFLATIIGIALDHRVIAGAPAWLKPAKFAISVSIYCFTFVWLLGFVQNRPRLVRLAGDVTVFSITVEMIVIITQAIRGTTSHFNMTTRLDSVLWMAMGGFIVLVWAMNLLLAILLIMQRMPDRAFAWSLRLGILISFVGMASAFLMVGPTHEQVVTLANHGPRIIGAHTVGAADGGPGLPVVGWSTVGGDLRIPHFAGLHGLQVLPFFGWLVTQKRRVFARLRDQHRLALVWIGGMGYLGMVLLLAWQALRGQSLIHCDSKTIAAFGVLMFGTALAGLITFIHAFRSSERVREVLCAGNSFRSSTGEDARRSIAKHTEMVSL